MTSFQFSRILYTHILGIHEKFQENISKYSISVHNKKNYADPAHADDVVYTYTSMFMYERLLFFKVFSVVCDTPAMSFHRLWLSYHDRTYFTHLWNMSPNHPLSNDRLNCCITYIKSFLSLKRLPRRCAISKQSPVGRGLVSMAVAQFSGDSAQRSPTVSWQRYDWEHCLGEK